MFTTPRYTLDITSDEPIMMLDEEVGQTPDGRGIVGSDFAEELYYLDTLGKKRIQIYINSPGGDIMDGFSIYSAILKSKTPVDTYCIGIAASVASWVFEAGRVRCMSDYGKLMVHNPYNEDGTEDKGLNAMRDSIVKMLAGRSGQPNATVSRWMTQETWFDAEEAMEDGLCDTVEKSADYNKSPITAVNVFEAFHQGKKMLKIYKIKSPVLITGLDKMKVAENNSSRGYISLESTKKLIQTMKEISLTEFLGLPATASAEEITEALNKMKASSTSANELTLEFQNKISKLEKKIAKNAQKTSFPESVTNPESLEDCVKMCNAMKDELIGQKESHEDLQAEHDDLFGKHMDLKKEHDALKKDHDDLKKTIGTMGDSKKNVAAMNLIAKYKNRLGNVSDEVLNAWVADAEKDAVATEIKLRALPQTTKTADITETIRSNEEFSTPTRADKYGTRYEDKDLSIMKNAIVTGDGAPKLNNYLQKKQADRMEANREKTRKAGF